jgi:transcriptional regulator with XRE-family HTH domain
VSLRSAGAAARTEHTSEAAIAGAARRRDPTVLFPTVCRCRTLLWPTFKPVKLQRIPTMAQASGSAKPLHIAFLLYSGMGDRSEVLRGVMHETGTTQSELARLSGVHQPSISQFLSGAKELSDSLLDRLLACMGYCLEITRGPVAPELTRSEHRSWMLHRKLARRLTSAALNDWRPTLEQNLARLRCSVSGEPHTRNLQTWERLIEYGDLPALHRVLTGLSRECIEMREVSPLAGLLAEDDRLRVMGLQP